MPPLRGCSSVVSFHLYNRNSVLTHSLKPIPSKNESMSFCVTHYTRLSYLVARTPDLRSGLMNAAASRLQFCSFIPSLQPEFGSHALTEAHPFQKRINVVLCDALHQAWCLVA